MSPRYINMRKFSLLIANLFLLRMVPMSLITLSVGVEVPWTPKLSNGRVLGLVQVPPGPRTPLHLNLLHVLIQLNFERPVSTIEHIVVIQETFLVFLFLWF